MWSGLTSVPERTFDGGPEDLGTLNFIDYQAGEHPNGVLGAALIFGGVLVRTGVFDWAVGDDGHLVLVTRLDYPRVMIFPYARLAEVENSSWPATGMAQRFDWLLEEVIVRVHVGGIEGDHLRPLLALVELRQNETQYWNAVRRALAVLPTDGKPGVR